MKLPINVKLPRTRVTNQVSDWLLERGMLGSISYNWYNGQLSFEHEEDAVAFCLAFGAERYESTVERMIRNDN